MSNSKYPWQVEISFRYSRHVGPTYIHAGLTLQFARLAFEERQRRQLAPRSTCSLSGRPGGLRRRRRPDAHTSNTLTEGLALYPMDVHLRSHENRRSLLQEGRHPLTAIRGHGIAPNGITLERNPVFQRRPDCRANTGFGVLNRYGRSRGNDGRDFQGSLDGARRLAQLHRQTEPKGRVRIDRISGHEHIGRKAWPYLTRQPLRPAVAGHAADLDFRLSETRVAAGDDEVAGKRDLASRAEGNGGLFDVPAGPRDSISLMSAPAAKDSSVPVRTTQRISLSSAMSSRWRAISMIMEL
jgi:hypothetical protein